MRPWIVALVVATVFAAAGPAVAAHTQRYEFAWQAKADSSYTQGYADEMTAQTVNMTLPGNVTRVLVRLFWVDDAGDPDQFTLRSDGPAGPAQNAGAAGEIEIAYDLAPPPAGNWSVDAASEPEARATSAAQHPPSGAPAGIWTFTIEAGDAGDGGYFFNPAPDPGNTWQLEVSWESHEAALVSATPIADAAAPTGPAPGAAPEDPALPPAGPPPEARAPSLGPMGIGLLAFAAVGVTLWALVAKWRKDGRLD